MNDDEDLAALADGRADLVVMGDGVTMRTHGPAACLGPFCCLHRPSPHPLAAAPMVWAAELKLMFRICVHKGMHPDPDSLEFHRLLALIGRGLAYDGWHPCCPYLCCEPPAPEPDDLAERVHGCGGGCSDWPRCLDPGWRAAA